MVNLMSDDPCDLPFLFATETTRSDFTSSRYEQFLRDQGVHGQGMWKTECVDHKRPKFGALKFDEDAWVLPSESVTLEFPCTAPEIPLNSWEEYYHHRELSLNSPAAILLTYPMTLYYVLTSLFGVEGKEPLTVHVIGAEKEADLLTAFSELQYLVPSLKLDLVLVGPLLSRRACRQTTTFSQVKVTLKRGLYHDLWAKMEEKPDFVIGFNAGLAAYRSWMETIKLIMNERVPAYFTEYCSESVSYTRQQLSTHPELSAKMAAEILNPFRSPIRICDQGSREPRFSNNYIYKLENG